MVTENVKCAIGDMVANKEENRKGKQTKRKLLVYKFQCSEVVCIKCRHSALTQMMWWGQKNVYTSHS